MRPTTAHLPAHSVLPAAVRAPLGRVALACLAFGLLVLLTASASSGAEWIALGDQGRTPTALQGVYAVSAGGTHTVALKVEGTVVAWGDDAYGQSTVPSGLDRVIAVAAGEYHTVALRSDGTVVAWGYDSAGQATVPEGMTDAIAIAAGFDFTLALKSDGTVVAWGDFVVPDGLADVTAIAAGSRHALALKSDGTVVGWGYDLNDQASVPDGLASVIAIAAGGQHSAALTSAGAVVAWGQDGNGQSRVPVDAMSGVTAIAAGSYHTVAVKSDGSVLSWGWQEQRTVPRGLTGVTAVAAGYNFTVALKGGAIEAWGSDSYGNNTVPADLAELTSIAVGGAHTVGLKADGTVIGWGYNGSGQCEIPVDLADVMAIAAGGEHAVALKSDGTVVAWGYSHHGQTDVPEGLGGVTAIAAGYYHTLALKSDGTVAAWGYDGSGQAAVPEGLAGVTAIAAGGYRSLALKSDGTVVSWGSGAAAPDRLTGVTAIAAGSGHAVALRSDGTVVTWDGVAVPAGLAGVTAIAAGSYHTVALKSDGTVVAWGSDEYGQVTVPVGLAGVTAIAAGAAQTWCRAAARPLNAASVISASVPYDHERHVLAMTTANGLAPTAMTYDGSTSPLAPGVYAVVGEADYLGSYGTATGTLTIGLQSIAFTAVGDLVYGAAPLALSATASSGLSPVFSVLSGPATISGSTMTVTGAGTVVIAADQAGDSGWQAAPQVTQTITVGKAAQTIAFPAIADAPYTGTDVTVSLNATASSGLAVSYSVVMGAATVTGTTLTISGAGNIRVAADQPGDADHLAAPQATVDINGVSQTITFPPVAPRVYAGSDIVVALGATASSGLTVSYAIVGGPGTISGNQLTITGAGTIDVAADQGGDGTYRAAPRVTRGIAVGRPGESGGGGGSDGCGLGSGLACVLLLAWLALHGLRFARGMRASAD